ncbi:hypothetical protein P872_21465 [Rhodonellum psychrophilum GCM71 = DSM 17998]|uniref:Uncharacterized protein n=2 Tax=Rhodonellum TaxID=336827 RepID=U5BXR3_9BACT|nr:MULTISPECIES: hypothetical protein [Rhodonellum]ERM80712.1 hypothetical protein P872_21465 [Rhodonellum psychrophilum GCM71 = DSM 17998]MDO9552119.1 transcriptional regulator [Rhodonellum sp.]SDZ57386.1 hypothetical protein SAMN05444412_1294 [Rhodonellum ikkaensis]
MKPTFIFFIFLLVQIPGFSQIQFLERFEINSNFNDNNFTILPSSEGLIAFRSLSEKGLGSKKKLQLLEMDYELKFEELSEINIRDNYELVGFDLDGDFFYAMLQKGTYQTDDRYVMEINLATMELKEINIKNVLNMELSEFLVLNRKAIFMGTTEMRPVVQIFDLETNNMVTVQGIYSKDTQILQLRKDPALGIFDILISKRDKFKMKQVLVLTFDGEGNKIREVMIDKLEDSDMEIVEGILTPIQNYQQSLIGPFGQRKREAFSGIYITNINEFGEFNTNYYTLEDFPNFYNYLNEKNREKKLRAVEKTIEKGRKPTISPVFSTREVINLEDGFLVYNDYFSASNPRYMPRDGVYANNIYRMNPFNPFMGGMYGDPLLGYGGYPRYPSMAREGEYKFISAQFALINKDGRVIWDNALNLENKTTADPSKFGEISFDGEKLHYLYLDGLEIKMSFLKNGEVIFENQPFEIQLIKENERIRDTQESSLQLTWWFQEYFLLSGKQKIRFQNESGKEEIREVFFITKIKVNGDLFVPEEGLKKQ